MAYITSNGTSGIVSYAPDYWATTTAADWTSVTVQVVDYEAPAPQAAKKLGKGIRGTRVPAKTAPDGPLAWLDRRVNEMRVAL